MTLTDRDRRLLMIILPIVILVGYWFLLLSPKRADLTTAQDELVQAEQRRDAAIDRVSVLERARQTFASDYAAVVRLGKAIPATIDSPSLLVQLDHAARGTGIDLNSVTFGERQSGVTVQQAPAQGAGAQQAQPEGNAAAGGVAAATGPGQAVEAAGEGAEGAETAQAQQGAQPTGPEAPASQAPPATLDAVAITFIFRGTYFDLADFLHRVKRFVYVQGERTFIRGRLVTIDSISFATQDAAEASGGVLATNVTATVYLSPKSQGTTAGATPAGPAGAETAAAEPAGNQTARRSPPTASVRSVR